MSDRQVVHMVRIGAVPIFDTHVRARTHKRLMRKSRSNLLHLLHMGRSVPPNAAPAPALAASVIERASAEGMQVFVRPTTAPSPHGPDSPIQIETAEDGRSMTVTLYSMPEELRREWVLRLGGAPGVQVIRQTRA
jgi:hypothetical protein